MLLSATAEYSSGPVTPSMRNRPWASWWPSERHRRAVSAKSSRPTSSLEELVPGGLDVADHGGGDVRSDMEGGGPRPASSPSTRPR